MVNDKMVNFIMKRNYIQPQTEAQMMQSLHVICNSPIPEITGGTEGRDPNSTEIF